MLKLRYLFDNRQLAETLLANWEADAAPFEWYRISSNAIYPFTWLGEQRFLRFAPVAEKPVSQVIAELDFLLHLDTIGYGAAVPLPSREGSLLVTQETPWGEYVATAFRAVPGTQLSGTELTDPIVSAYGRALAELHLHAARYRPGTARRWSESDVLDWIRTTLAPLADAEPARKETEQIAQALLRLPRHSEDYGLIHYDFECDDVFYDAASARCHAIDFDDAMYNWFAVDIEQALASLAEEVAPDRAAATEQVFLAAYASVRPLPDDFDALRRIGRRFADLYWYARVRRSLAETFDVEPDWMTGLRDSLAAGLRERSERFGLSLD